MREEFVSYPSVWIAIAIADSAIREPTSSIDNAIANCVANQRGEGVQTELAHERGPVSFRGADADSKGIGDLLVAPAFGKKARYFSFPFRQGMFLPVSLFP
jgi:hypothetical protein